MRALAAAARLGAVRRFTWRLEVGVSVVAALALVGVVVSLWTAAAHDGPVAGLSRGALATYVVIAWLVPTAVGGRVEEWLGERLLSDEVDADLLRPLDLHAHALARHLGRSAASAVWVAAPALLLLTAWFPVAAPASLGAAAAFVAAVGLAAVVGGQLGFVVGLVAPALRGVRGLAHAKAAAVWLLSGALIPVAALPEPVAALARLTPLPALADLPARVWLGEGAAMLLAIQAGWAVALAVACRLAQRCALGRIREGGFAGALRERRPMRVEAETASAGPARAPIRLGALRLRLAALIARPGDSLARAAADALTTAAGVALVVAVFRHTDAVAGWSVGEVLMAWGLAQATLGLVRALFAGLWVVNRRYLLDGGLDAVLLRPASPYSQVMAAHLEPGALLLTAGGLAVFAWGASLAGVAASVATVALLALFVLGGTLLLAGMLTATASIGFFTAHRGSAVGLVSSLIGLAHVPPEALPRLWAWALTTVAPLALTGIVPVAAFTGRAPWATLAVLQPLVGLVAFAAGLALWRAGLARYTSRGS